MIWRYGIAWALVCASAWGAQTHYAIGTLAASQIDEQVSFLVLDLSSLDATFWATVQADGDDIELRRSDGVTVIPHYLLDSFDTVSEVGKVLIPGDEASTSVDTDIRIYFGDGAASSTSDGAAVLSGTSVVALWTLTGADGLTDITGNGYDLTATGSPTSGVAGPKTAMEGYDFNGTSQYLSRTTSPLADGWNTSGMTIECWFESDSDSANQTMVALGRNTTDTLSQAKLVAAGAVGADPLQAVLAGDSGFQRTATSSSGYTANTYHHAMFGREANSGTTTVWLDFANTGTNSVLLNTPTLNRVGVGALVANTVLEYFNGAISFVVMHNAKKSANYASTLQDMWANSGFLTWGSSTAIPGDGETDWVEFSSAVSVTADGTPTWTNITNALTSLGTAATASIVDGDKSRQIWLTNVGSGLDEVIGETITGIAVEVVATGEDGFQQAIYDYKYRMIVGGSLAGDEFQNSITPWTDTTQVTREYGGAGETFSTSLTDTQATASNFGVMVSYASEGMTTALVSVYRVRVKLFYGAGSSTANSGFFLLFD